MRWYGLLVLGAGLLIAAERAKKGTEGDLKKMEGSWVLVSGEDKGKKLSTEVVKNASLTVTGNKHVVKVGDDTIIGTHKLDPTKTPKAIDAQDTEGPFQGKEIHGIYKLSRGEFTVCFAPPGKARPRNFTTKSGTATLLHVWKRAK